MKTVNEVSKLTGVTVRALRYYDSIGLLKPTQVTPAGYRLYDRQALGKLQRILLFRELQFPLKEIKAILEDPGFDYPKALKQQIRLLTLKKERLEQLIALAEQIRKKGENNMDFTAFDTEKIDRYAKQAKAAWGKTPQYREFEKKSQRRTGTENQALLEEMMDLFVEFGRLRKLSPGSKEVQSQVKRLQEFITRHFYACSDETLLSLGLMYASQEEFRENIDRAGGPGTAQFVCDAICICTPEP